MTVLKPLADAIFGESRVRDFLRELGIAGSMAANELYWRAASRNQHRALAEKTGEILVNLACGWHVVPGWVNLDISPTRPGVIYYDAHKPMPFESHSVSHIHSEHFLEHLEYRHALGLLRECHRVLRPGGTLRLIVPDAEKYFRAYVENDQAFFQASRMLGDPPEPFETRAQIINQMFRMANAHKFAWDFETLELVLSRIGFSAIARSSAHDTPHDIDGTEDWRMRESLYLNVTK
jgi:predicted SAM-dependent methyltransferase